MDRQHVASHYNSEMNNEHSKDIQRWCATWQRAGRELEHVRNNELANMSDDAALAAALDMLNMPIPADMPPRNTSGLVEQQRLFSTLRRI